MTIRLDGPFSFDKDSVAKTVDDLPPAFICLSTTLKGAVKLENAMVTDIALVLYPPRPVNPTEAARWAPKLIRMMTPGWANSDPLHAAKLMGLTQDLKNNGYPPPISMKATRELICLINAVDLSRHTLTERVTRGKGDDAALDRQRVERNETNSSPYNKVFREIITRAVGYDTADIHLEVRYGEDPMLKKNGSRVRFRIDGELIEPPGLGSDTKDPAFLRAMSGFVFSELAEGHSGPQFAPALFQSAQVKDMVISTGTSERVIRGRYQTFDGTGNMSANGDKPFDLVMRVLYADRVDIPTLQELGFLPWQRKVLQRLIDGQSKLGCVSGKVGSGKSTTLRTLFSMLPDYWKKYSAEDPVEYYHPNTSSLNATSPEIITLILKSLKRGDLNSLLMGEVRNADTMSLIRNVTFSGHSVFTTTHSESALAQIPYFLTPEMGMNNHELSNPAFIGLLFHQTLTKVLCPHCAVGGAAAHQVLGLERLRKLEKEYKVPVDGLKVRSEHGCNQCQSELPSRIGYTAKKMDVLAEMFEPDLEDLRLIEQNKLIDLTIKWRESHDPFDSASCHGKTWQEVGLFKALNGTLDLRSVEAKGRPFVDMQVFNKPVAGPSAPVPPAAGAS